MATPLQRVAPAPAPDRTTSFRWAICGLLFLAATINYIDRQVIGILKPTLQQQYGWSELDYADIVLAFQLAYAIGFVLAGRLMDRLGTKKGFALALAVWSIAALAHAEATSFGAPVSRMLALVGLQYSASVAGFMAARFALGLGESGNFPAALKAVSEWFPLRERALATGIFNAGTNVGALITPLVVPFITIRYGWYWAFVVTGGLGFAWLIAWWSLYDAPARITGEPAEPVTTVPWTSLLSHRQTWAFVLGKFMTDPIWWVYLFWIPDFFSRTHGLSLGELGPPIVTIYLVADLGSVGGGWLSSTLIQRGWTVNASR